MRLDFKFEVDDPEKIARSLASFANTDGGLLLIGVRDDGSISGIQSDEEVYMLKTAALKYCTPEVKFTSKEWTLNSKKILEVYIPKSNLAPHKAPDQKGKFKVFIRVNDQNMLANGVQMKIWQKLNADKDINFVYSDEAKTLLSLLKHDNSLSLSQIIDSIKQSRYVIENMLAELIIMKIINMTVDETITSFSLIDPVDSEK